MKGQMVIRDFREGDIASLVKFKQESARISFPGQSLDSRKFGAFLARKHQKHPGSIKVLEVNGKQAGYINMSIKSTVLGSYGMVNHIFVMKKYRNAGLGTRLMKAAESYFKSKGIKRISLKITLTNKASLEFCRKLGYRDKRLVLEKRI